jgi:hypothetical protein
LKYDFGRLVACSGIDGKTHSIGRRHGTVAASLTDAYHGQPHLIRTQFLKKVCAAHTRDFVCQLIRYFGPIGSNARRRQLEVEVPALYPALKAQQRDL